MRGPLSSTLVAALLAVVPGPVLADDERGPSVDVALDVRVVALIEEEVFAPEELLDALLALGPPAVEAAWAVTCGLAQAPGGDDLPDDLWTGVLAGTSRPRLVEALQATLAEDVPFSSLERAVDVLVARGEVEGLPVVCDLAAKLTPTALQSVRTRTWFTRRVLELTRGAPGDARPFLVLGRSSVPSRLAGAVDLALLEAGDDAPLARLREARGDEPELLHLLDGVVELRTDLPCTDELVFALEELLRSRNERVRALTVAALASRGVTRLTETWLQLTGDRSPQVRRAARRALERTTRVAWPADEDGWERWWAGESAWIDEELPTLVDALRGQDRAAQVRALRLVVQHPAAAHRFVDELELLVHGPDTDLAVRCVGALGTLADPSARRLLAEALADDRPEVEGAAARCLGVELPDDAEDGSSEEDDA